MDKSWNTLEDNVRKIAGFKWSRNCSPQKIAGVDVDGVIELESDYFILIEVTERKSLNKTREDINKLLIARNALVAKNVYAKCYCISSEQPTPAMQLAGKDNSINVMSFRDFVKDFYDYQNYYYIRSRKSFGSSANPYTGEIDKTDYIPVYYKSKRNGNDIEVAEIAKKIQKGGKVVLLGDYGTGKSRCVKELFTILSSTRKTEKVYPLAIDLRDNWGLKSAPEIIRRHLSDLGMDNSADNVVRSYQDVPFCFLLDGFDEIGSQSWNYEQSQLRTIRKQSLDGVRNLIQSSSYGVLVTGRKHYFNTDEEMYDSLGLDPGSTEVIECYEEFTEEQMNEFLKTISKDTVLPVWLPRRPLVCQVVVSMNPEELSRLFESNEGIPDFWDAFINAVTKRESKIRSSLDAESIRAILRIVARYTRMKPMEVGPITQSEINKAFEIVVGTPPVGESSLVLHRLPGLGRVRIETDERQFLDMFVLDALRAEDTINCVNSHDKTILSENWKNPLRHYGQHILSYEIFGKEKSKVSHYLAYLKNSEDSRNTILLSDIITALIESSINKTIDFSGFTLVDGHIPQLDLSNGTPVNLELKECIIEEMTLPKVSPVNTFFHECTIRQLYGISSTSSMPEWLIKCDIERLERVDTVSRIKKAKLSVPHQILIIIIRKTFFQPGSARMEDALLRGIGVIDNKGYTKKILRMLIREKILSTAKGREGLLYVPNGSAKDRMTQIIEKLSHSADPLWEQIGELSKD